MTVPLSIVEERLRWLEDRIDPSRVAEVERRHDQVFSFSPIDRLPVLITMRDDVAHVSRSHGDWPSFSFGRMWSDYGAMLLNELQPAYESVLFRDDKVFTVRPNLSQLVVPSLFGAQSTLLRDDEDAMPAVHVRPSKEKLRATIADPPDIHAHWATRKYCEIIDRWRELLKGYPVLERSVHFCLPDLQGPFNVYHLLRGTEAFIDVHDEPDLVHEMMRGITRVLVEMTSYLSAYLGDDCHGYYWSYRYPGSMRNVDDSSILLSREMYREFVAPWNTELARACGGGIHHYCGKGDHILDLVMDTVGIHGLNFGNPEAQDWDAVRAMGARKKVVLLWDRKIPADKLARCSTGVIMKLVVSDVASGKEAAAEYGL